MDSAGVAACEVSHEGEIGAKPNVKTIEKGDSVVHSFMCPLLASVNHTWTTAGFV